MSASIASESRWTIGPAKPGVEGTVELAVLDGPWTERVEVAPASLLVEARLEAEALRIQIADRAVGVDRALARAEVELRLTREALRRLRDADPPSEAP